MLVFTDRLEFTNFFRWLVEICAASILLSGLFFTPAYAVEVPRMPVKKPSLFGTMEIRAESKLAFRKWNNMLARHSSKDRKSVIRPCEPSFFTRCHINDWKSFLKDAADDTAQAKVEGVNGFANRIRYIEDMRNYRVPDYWATPEEFFHNQGDCEDYAITKYMSLKTLGIPVKHMRIVVLRDTNIQEYHAVLVIKVGSQALVLDNQTNVVADHRKIHHYKPIYSLNENGAWFHVR